MERETKRAVNQQTKAPSQTPISSADFFVSF
jgi:hypothetical protein